MLEQRIDHIIRPSLLNEGFDVVCVRIAGSKKNIVQVFIEKTDAQPVTVENCATSSHIIATLLDVENPMPEAYTLEVSSPGLERPLWRSQDYARFCGRHVKFQTSEAIGGQKKFVGTISKAQEDHVVFIIHHEEKEDYPLMVPYLQIQKAHLTYP